jgi:quinol monooxygenase YgiN
MDILGPASTGTVKHVVMWRLQGRGPDERAIASARVKTAFEGLRGLIPGMLSLEVGTDPAAESDACHAVLVTEFESRAALEAYATHPAHVQVREELAGVRTARFQVDYQVSP